MDQQTRTNSKHKRSYSDSSSYEKKVEKQKLMTNSLMPDFNSGNNVETKRRRPENNDIQNSLKQEILQLQERLREQFVVRQAMENALSYRPFSFDTMNDNSVPQAAKEVIKDIALLELEVSHLEKYLLSLYRKTHSQQVMVSSPKRLNATTNVDKKMSRDEYKHDTKLESRVEESSHDTWREQTLLDSGIHRSHSSLSQHSVPMKALATAFDSYHSLPLHMLEQNNSDSSNTRSLAEHFGIGTLNQTPTWISEEMLKCMSAVYCELADPPLINPDYVSSPLSYSSSLEGQDQLGDTWSPQCRKISRYSSQYGNNPFHYGASAEFSPYCTMVKVISLFRDGHKLKKVEHKLREYRSLVHRLEKVNPSKMKHEEKLAFWINVHNTLVMHAFLAYGIPQNSLKRMSSLLKAAYNIGGHTISVDALQSVILGCRLPRPGNWLKLLFPPRKKFKVGDARRNYVIEHPEPRLYFALCCGCQSDPAVRIYTPKTVFQDLEAAKEEYIQSTFGLLNNKEEKMALPKIVESFIKDSELCPAGLNEMIEDIIPYSLRNKKKRNGKNIEWIPHNFTFQYLLSRELA
ncbi:hypothetical protein ACFE04_023109 [Oxalis oulophora]